MAPSSVHWEVGNGLSAALRRKRLTPPQVQQALIRYKAIPIAFLDVDLSEALDWAAKLNVYAYDAYILTCGLKRNLQILSLDTNLIAHAKAIGAKVVEV